MHDTKIISVRLNAKEYDAFMKLAGGRNLKPSSCLRGLIRRELEQRPDVNPRDLSLEKSIAWSLAAVIYFLKNASGTADIEAINDDAERLEQDILSRFTLTGADLRE